MNSLVEQTKTELRDEAFRISNIESFYNIATSDIYVDDLTLPELLSYASYIKNSEQYTVSQIKYILDTAITIATE